MDGSATAGISSSAEENAVPSKPVANLLDDVRWCVAEKRNAGSNKTMIGDCRWIDTDTGRAAIITGEDDIEPATCLVCRFRHVLNQPNWSMMVRNSVEAGRE